ncbi:hypothetical protein LA080_004767 [Diaporthe eres]|nr:hypothetical protein LA080_004767 [Diaporthe eres]
MKLSTAILLIAAMAKGVFSTDQDECGSLGLMVVDEAKLPAGVNASDVRKCADHPLGRRAGPGLAKRGGGCGGHAGRLSGCSNGYCWKDCHGIDAYIGQNFGAWCWTAKGDESYGNWYPCTRDSDCKPSYTCASMSPNKIAPSPSARGASTTTAQETAFSGGPYEVGVELEDVGRAQETRTSATADRCTRQPPRSVCFLVEDCKWCRPNTNTNTQSDRVTLPEQEETPAVRALRECLANLHCDRRAAEARPTSCLDTVIERYVARRRKSA